MEAGSRGREIFVVRSGTVRVPGDVTVGERRCLRSGMCDLQGGAVFGELALFDRRPRSASVVAVTECELAVVDGQRLLAFFDAHPTLGYPVLQVLVGTLVRRLRRTNDKLFSVFA